MNLRDCLEPFYFVFTLAVTVKELSILSLNAKNTIQIAKKGRFLTQEIAVIPTLPTKKGVCMHLHMFARRKVDYWLDLCYASLRQFTRR